MEESKYKYDHLISILINKDGWLRVPLFTGREKLIVKKQDRNVLSLQKVYEGSR